MVTVQTPTAAISAPPGPVMMAIKKTATVVFPLVRKLAKIRIPEHCLPMPAIRMRPVLPVDRPRKSKPDGHVRVVIQRAEPIPILA